MPHSPLSIESIRAHLTTRTLGRRLTVQQQIDSTNRFLAELASKGEPDGAVAAADSQTAGRGRLGRRWISPPGMNLYVSILFSRAEALKAPTWIPLLAAVAVVQTLRRHVQLAARLKWPNDVLIVRHGQGRKLAGILVETAGGQAGLRPVVAGIGLNVNMPADAFPEDLRAGATSLLIETGRTVEREPLLASLLGEVEALYEELCAHGSDAIAAAYRESCDTIGQKVRIEMSGHAPVEGTAEDLAPDGALRLRTSQGKILEIRAGDVVHLR